MTPTATDHDAMTGAVFALRLVDRRTGAPERANGAVLAIFTRTPEAAAAKALRDRDASVWQVRVAWLHAVDAAARG